MSGLTSTGFVAETTSSELAKIESDELAAIDPALNLSPVQPLGQINGIFASAAATLWALVQAIYAAFDPSAAVGVQLDNLCAITGCVRLPATKTLVLCTVNLNAGTYAAGTLTANIVGHPEFTFVNRDTIVAPGGAITNVVFLATVTGPIVANSSTLTVITNPVAGWISITNPTNGTTGTLVETDTALRRRRAALLVASGGCTIDSIRSSLLNPALVPGIIQASVLENTSMVTDANGLPAKSFAAIIWDGSSPAADNAKIAQAIWNSKPAGIQSYGATYATFYDQAGVFRIVYFTRVTAVPIYFALTVKINPGIFLASGPQAIKDAMVALGAAQVSGQTVIALRMRAAALTVLGVVDVTVFQLGTAPAPVGTVNLAMTPFQLATFSTANITVLMT